MANMNHLKNQAMMSAQMQRDGSGVDLNGQRPHSPSSTENAPSPSKRPRLDSTAFNGQPMGARTQGIPPQAMGASAVGPGGQMMLGINGANGPGGHFNDFGQQGPHPKIEVCPNSISFWRSFVTSPKGVNSGAQGSPMNSQALEGSNDMFASNAQAAAGSGGNQSTPTHALQDYQLQLMLLEQQNKKRLLMAKQEQDSISQWPHGPSAPGAAHVFAPAMSPQGSRTGPSPNPADQIKRGTPKLGHQGLPGSPMGADGLQPNRNSPAPNFEHQMQPPPLALLPRDARQPHDATAGLTSRQFRQPHGASADRGASQRPSAQRGLARRPASHDARPSGSAARPRQRHAAPEPHAPAPCSARWRPARPGLGAFAVPAIRRAADAVAEHQARPAQEGQQGHEEGTSRLHASIVSCSADTGSRSLPRKTRLLPALRQLARPSPHRPPLRPRPLPPCTRNLSILPRMGRRSHSRPLLLLRFRWPRRRPRFRRPWTTTRHLAILAKR